MPSDTVFDRLVDIRDNARLAQEWIAEYTRESFAKNAKTFYAVTRCLEIVSEASRKLPPELRERHPELPWRAIMDVGNVYRHAYDNVSEDAVWRTVQERLPVLLAVIEDEIAIIESQELLPGGEEHDSAPDESPPDIKPETEKQPDMEPEPSFVVSSRRYEPGESKQRINLALGKRHENDLHKSSLFFLKSTARLDAVENGMARTNEPPRI